MISENQQDQAALHALGLLDDDEAAEFRQALAADPELRVLSEELSASTAALALAAGPETRQPPPTLKARVLAMVERESSKTVRTSRRPWTQWVPWAIAAAAVLSAILSGMDRTRLMQDRDRLYARWMDARLQSAQEAGARQLDDEARRKVSPLTQLAACQLEPTPTGPEKPRATVVWDPARRQGELLVTQLKPPASGHDYQLWAVEEGSKEPVSAGLVQVDAGGQAKIEFKPVGTDGKVQAFALSLEQAGGSERNQGPILLLGKL